MQSVVICVEQLWKMLLGILVYKYNLFTVQYMRKYINFSDEFYAYVLLYVQMTVAIIRPEVLS